MSAFGSDPPKPPPPQPPPDTGAADAAAAAERQKAHRRVGRARIVSRPRRAADHERSGAGRARSAGPSRWPLRLNSMGPHAAVIVADYTSGDQTNGTRPKRESEAPDGARLVKRYERGLERRSTVDTTQQRILEYIIPHKADITRTRTEGQERTEKVWDSTAIQANKLLASSIQGSLMSQAIRWFRLVLRNQDLMTKPVTDWLEDVVEILYQALRQSNFYAEASELCLNLGAIGIGAIFVEERKKTRREQGFGGFRFQTIGGRYVIEENPEGRVDTFFRAFPMSARNIQDSWPNAELPDPIRTSLPERPDKEFEIVHAVYPRRVRNPKRKDAQHMKWASCYIFRSTKTILSEGGMKSSRTSSRGGTRKAKGSTGMVPAISRPDIRTLISGDRAGTLRGQQSARPSRSR